MDHPQSCTHTMQNRAQSIESADSTVVRRQRLLDHWALLLIPLGVSICLEQTSAMPRRADGRTPARALARATAGSPPAWGVPEQPRSCVQPPGPQSVG